VLWRNLLDGGPHPNRMFCETAFDNRFDELEIVAIKFVIACIHWLLFVSHSDECDQFDRFQLFTADLLTRERYSLKDDSFPMPELQPLA
jgi:hypothetical protein